MLYSTQEQIDDLLQRIAEKLQITDTQHNKATARYNGVADWLSAENSPFSNIDVSIYPQGSLKLGTTVKPKGQDEFDVDLVCEFKSSLFTEDPVAVLNKMEARLRDNDNYSHMVQRHNRCIRLNYADEFHMDILPACPDPRTEDCCILVPDRSLREWKESNPLGFSDWFEDQSKIRIAKEAMRADVSPVPEKEPALMKPPLKRSVQLLKRHRDLCYTKYPELAPISIVLTTISAHYYDGQESVIGSLLSILQKTNDTLRAIPSGKRFKVLNPTNDAEDFSEKWDPHPERYEEFKRWIPKTQRELTTLYHCTDMDTASEILTSLFGETLTKDAFSEQAEFLRKSRTDGNLRTTSLGTLSLRPEQDTKPIKKHTFYGE